MQHYLLNDMLRGWFVGNFNPSSFKTEACEVAVKKYQRGDYEAAHFHKVATEITLVLAGKIKMLNKIWQRDDIIILSPGEITDFTALTSAVCVVVKVPGAVDDKYLTQQK